MYIGNTPAENYASFLTETFSVSATVNYTLSHAVSNENDIRLVINGVVQQPGSGKAYTASGTTLTLTSATSSGDSMYAVYLGRALQTVNPPNASVGTAQLANDSVTLAKMASGTDGNIISYDASGNPVAVATGNDGQVLTSAGAGASPVFETLPVSSNNVRFLARKTSNQNISNDTAVKVTFESESYDTGCFASNRFTVPSGEAGIYMLYAGIRCNGNAASVVQYAEGNMYLNGTRVILTSLDFRNNYGGYGNSITSSVALNLSVGNYVEIFAGIGLTSGTPSVDGHSSEYRSWFGGYKLIT